MLNWFSCVKIAIDFEVQLGSVVYEKETEDSDLQEYGKQGL